MSVFPVKLPLYPILNASDSVQRMLEKDAEDAKVWPDKDSNGADQVEKEPGGSVDPSTRFTPVEGAAVTLETVTARPGGEEEPGAIELGEAAEDPDKEDEDQPMRLDMRS